MFFLNSILWLLGCVADIAVVGALGIVNSSSNTLLVGRKGQMHS